MISPPPLLAPSKGPILKTHKILQLAHSGILIGGFFVRGMTSLFSRVPISCCPAIAYVIVETKERLQERKKGKGCQRKNDPVLFERDD